MSIVQRLRRLFKTIVHRQEILQAGKEEQLAPVAQFATIPPTLRGTSEPDVQRDNVYRTPIQVKSEFQAHPRRALVITTVLSESRSVKAFLTNPVVVVGEKGAFYEYGRFSDPAGEWLIVHAITSQGNTDASLVVSKAHQEFGSFHAQMFVGVAGSLKADIPIGSVVIGDYVYNGHSAKVEDTETLGRPHSLVPARELLTASQALIYSEEWIDLIRAPTGIELPKKAEYPCDFPPIAAIKGIVSGEEVVAGGRSARFAWLRSHFNDCGAVEMEGWGAMSAARHENTPAIVIRGISDMCAGKDHTTDKLHQPIAAAHAAAFAFGILSFRSKVRGTEAPAVGPEIREPGVVEGREAPPVRERRVEFVFNFEGSRDDWSTEKVDAVVERLRQTIEDENLGLIRIDAGSVRLVMSVRESDLATMDLAKLREAASDSGVTLLGAMPLGKLGETEEARMALAAASVDLLSWERTLPNGRWMDRPERESIEARFQHHTSTTVLLGEPGSGKSALLSRIAADLLGRAAPVFALKADFLSAEVRTEADLQRELHLPDLPSNLILRLSELQPVYVLIDQLDALASQLDLRSGRLNVLLNLVRRISTAPNVHVLLSARTFEFNHDVRLRAIDAEAVSLALPPWHEVKERLAEVGVDPDAWPEKARDVVRIPQALKTFITLVGSGRTEPFSTYQAMLEQFWSDRVASADDSAGLIALASSLAGQMAEEEVLWLAASRFDDQLNNLKRLEALGLIVRSENNLSVAFSHQTLFDYVLARTFVRSAGLLSKYVLERQDSLFVRAKVWSALNYLRGAEVKSYEREFVEIWKTKDLRRHLRLLLIEFLGQVTHPLELERVCMGEVLNSPDLRIVGLKAISGNSGWFPHFASTAIRDAMLGPDPEASQASRILGLAWKGHAEHVLRLIKECWLPDREKDTYSWATVRENALWTPDIEEVAATVLKRTPIAIWHVGHAATVLAVEQPDVALRLVRVKLDYLLDEAKREPPPPPFPSAGTEEEKTVWYMRHDDGIKALKNLLDAVEWVDIPSLAEAAPGAFLQNCWSWYVSVFSEILVRKGSGGVGHIYPGRYALEIDLVSTEQRSSSQEKPVLSAIQIAVEELAQDSPKHFVEWADANSNLEMLAVQQLIARGYEIAAEQLASKALKWILLDSRRFQLGTVYGHRRTTSDLVSACAPHWTKGEVEQIERAVLSYHPSIPDHFKEPNERRAFADMIRATKKDLLQAIGIERLARESRDLVATEQRALGDRFDRSISIGEGGFIGSPMQAGAMAKAKDRDILGIFREIPDNSNWDHPTHWMRGGNIQLSRAFAEFARTNPDRAIRLMEQFEPLQQERAAGYALEAMADDAPNDSRIVEAFLDLHARGFRASEFTDSAARALEKIADRSANISDEIVDILIGWLELASRPKEEDDVEGTSALTSQSKDGDLRNGSILWGHGGVSILPGGNFNVLSALASILNKDEVGRERFFSILDDHLVRERNPNIWKPLLYRLSQAGGSTPQAASAFFRKLFGRFPEILATQEVVIFLARAQRWDDQLVFDVICDWRSSDRVFFQRAYGELVGLIAIGNAKSEWIRMRDEIIVSGNDEMKIGLAHSAVNLRPDRRLGPEACQTLIALLKDASKDLVAVVMDVFRVSDEIAPDASTVLLLRALAAEDVDLSAAPSHFIVERLQALLPHEAELVATIAGKLVAAWRGELGDIRTATAIAAPQLTDLALTLHRLGGASRQAGVALFEAMIEIDAYGARDTLAEIDGRFGPHQGAARQRLSRQRKPRRLRRAVG